MTARHAATQINGRQNLSKLRGSWRGKDLQPPKDAQEGALEETGVSKPLCQAPLNSSALSPLPTGDPATATSVQESPLPT